MILLKCHGLAILHLFFFDASDGDIEREGENCDNQGRNEKPPSAEIVLVNRLACFCGDLRGGSKTAGGDFRKLIKIE